ncbi:MAG: hypothetical protein ABIC04_02875 [Nanoarchaeota archaeon]
MERFQELRAAAQKKLQLADHMLTMTYPFVRDPKLLVTVIENLFLALTSAMGSLLYYERTFKKIPPFQDNFSSKYSMFKSCIKDYDINNEILSLIKDLRDIIIAHQKSPVEFSKKDRFIICSEDYQMRTVSLDNLKDYIKKTKLFIHQINNIVSKHESIFN